MITAVYLVEEMYIAVLLQWLLTPTIRRQWQYKTVNQLAQMKYTEKSSFTNKQNEQITNSAFSSDIFHAVYHLYLSHFIITCKFVEEIFVLLFPLVFVSLSKEIYTQSRHLGQKNYSKEAPLKVLGKSVGSCKTTKRKDQLYISLLVSVWRIICEIFNPNKLILAEIWMKI